MCRFTSRECPDGRSDQVNYRSGRTGGCCTPVAVRCQVDPQAITRNQWPVQVDYRRLWRKVGPSITGRRSHQAKIRPIQASLRPLEEDPSWTSRYDPCIGPEYCWTKPCCRRMHCSSRQARRSRCCKRSNHERSRDKTREYEHDRWPYACPSWINEQGRCIQQAYWRDEAALRLMCCWRVKAPSSYSRNLVTWTSALDAHTRKHLKPRCQPILYDSKRSLEFSEPPLADDRPRLCLLQLTQRLVE
jgi:hypothetical protein